MRMESETDGQRDRASPPNARWRGFWMLMAGFVLYWLALPPAGAWPLGWLVFAPWTAVVCGPDAIQPGAFRTWLAGWIFWLGAMYFIPMPHPALWIAWPLLCGYMALYPLAFFWISRRLVGRMGWPAVLVMPAAWAMLEWVRGWMITGFSMGMLAHSQFQQPWLIQLASVGGDCLVSLVMAIVGTAAGTVLFLRSRPEQMRWAMPVAVLTVATVSGWGWYRLNSGEPAVRAGNGAGTPVILVQGSVDTILFGPEQAGQQMQWLYDQRSQYQELTLEARQKWPAARLVVWPEGIFNEWVFLDDLHDLSSRMDEQVSGMIRQAPLRIREEWAAMMGVHSVGSGAAASSGASPVALLTGVPAVRYIEGENYNAAALIDDSGAVVNIYKKNHRVIFGEYLPLAKVFPLIDRLSPVGRGLDRGLHAAGFHFDGLVMMPEICFETTVSHLVRRHWHELNSGGNAPDAIFCLTNDGWFFGSSCLDLHLACNVFRAVETATPLLVAANTGFSAEIDGRGRILQQGPRRETAAILANLGPRTPEITVNLATGDWPWLGLTVLLLGGMVASRWRNIS